MLASGIPEGTTGWLRYGAQVDPGGPDPSSEAWLFTVQADRSQDRAVDAQSCTVVR